MSKTVLIVEDNELNMNLFHDLLEAHGYNIVGTRNGIEALDLARKHKPDLVLMDIQLPGISGIEAFKQIRGNAATRAIPVIALTASVTPTDRSAITAAGFDAFLGKPINLKEFLDTVKRLVEGANKGETKT
jgi:two-component system, cell cycle response regulator DivK